MTKIPPLPKDTLRMGIGYLAIGTRAHNVFRNNGIVDVEQVIKLGDRMLDFPYFGKLTLEEVRRACRDLAPSMMYLWGKR
jgi:hypothetical protein